jgi:hypothetical protein
MKYELITTSISGETTVMQDILDEYGNVIGQEPTDEYEVKITLELKPTDDIAPHFYKTIAVKSDNHMTGFEVDDQREQAVTDFMASINE